MSVATLKRRTAALWLSLWALSLQPGLFAENGRNFAASYQIRKVQQDTSVVTFQLSLKLFNYSGADVNDAKITVTSYAPQPDTAALDYRGSFDSVSVRYRKLTDLKGTFSVPEAEYHRWQRGATPRLTISYVNSAGEPVQSVIELSRNR